MERPPFIDCYSNDYIKIVRVNSFIKIITSTTTTPTKYQTGTSLVHPVHWVASSSTHTNRQKASRYSIN